MIDAPVLTVALTMPGLVSVNSPNNFIFNSYVPMNFQLPQSPPPFNLTGRELGDYQILRRLGRGGMADVYLARQVSLDRNVALKILKPELAKDESYIQRFRQEAQAAARLRQANIVQIHEVGEREGYHYISQEYVQGRNLNQYLSRHGAVEPVMAINVLRQCALALQESSNHGVIHRDIKPENIMLSINGEVKITDFGLARVNNDASKQALTQVGVTMGTPLYMSPEQVEGADVDQRSDIYSLGVTAYHMLAGHPPFEGDNALSIAVQHVKDDPVELSHLRPDLPDELCQSVRTMMSKERDQRPADAKQLLKELRKIKIDVDDDWEMIAERLSFSESYSTRATASMSQAKIAATMQLQQVMKGNVRSWWKSASILLTVGTLALAGAIGGIAVARQTAPDPLLSVSAEELTLPKVSRLGSSTEQLKEAEVWPGILKKDPEPYYQAVLDYWPLDVEPESDGMTLFNNRLAKERLSEIFIEANRDGEASEIFEQFVGFDDLAEEFKAVGIVGQAIVLDRMELADFADRYPEDSGRSPEEFKKSQQQKVGEAIIKLRGKEELLDDFPFYKVRYQALFERLNQVEPVPREWTIQEPSFE